MDDGGYCRAYCPLSCYKVAKGLEGREVGSGVEKECCQQEFLEWGELSRKEWRP